MLRIVYIFFLLACSLHVFAQSGFFNGRHSAVYARITGNVQADIPGEDRLAGPVKIVDEREQRIQEKDTTDSPVTFLRYSHDGVTEYIRGDSTVYHNYSRVLFTYTGGKLQTITTTTHEGVETLTYSSGYLQEQHYRSFSDASLNVKATYSYNSSHDKVNVRYRYEQAESSWEREVNKTYTFKFDKKGNLVTEGMRDAENYGYTLTFTYDSLNRVTSQHYLSSCFGSNSCVNAWVNYTYDEHGNIPEEVAGDATICNALWCFCYHYLTTYDLHGNMIARTYLPAGGRRDPVVVNAATKPGKQPEPEPGLRVTYVYDNHGNWIRKKETFGKSETITTRKIAYY